MASVSGGGAEKSVLWLAQAGQFKPENVDSPVKPGNDKRTSKAQHQPDVLHRRASKLGTARVRQELQSKGLSPEAMGEALEKLRSTELERAREVWGRKFSTVASDPKEKARQIRFLVSRGFAAEVVRRVVQGVTED